MKFNPTASAFWLFCTGVGYLIGGDLYSAIFGAVVGLGISLLADLLL